MRKVLLAIGLVFGLAGLVLFFKTRPGASAPSPSPEPEAIASAEPESPNHQSAPAADPPEAMAADNATAEESGVRESALDRVLGSADTEAAKAEQLLVLLNRVTGEEQVEVAQHLVNLLADEQFANAGRRC